MIQVVLITRTGKAYLANGIAAFTLDKEAYTPYSQLTATVYGNFSIQQFAGIYRVQLLLDGTELHFGTVEKFRLVQENGTSYVRFSSRGLTALLLQNQLEPGLHTAMSLDKLMQDFVTFPKEITWESDTDTSNYLFVKESTSMWDGVANLTYKLCGRYPFVYHANEIRMHLPETYRNFYVGADTLLGMGMTADQSRIYSRFSMADADGTYGKFQENDPNAAALELVRTKQLLCCFQFRLRQNVHHAEHHLRYVLLAVQCKLLHCRIGCRTVFRTCDFQVFRFCAGVQADGYNVHQSFQVCRCLSAVDQVRQSVGVDANGLDTAGFQQLCGFAQGFQPFGRFAEAAEYHFLIAGQVFLVQCFPNLFHRRFMIQPQRVGTICPVTHGADTKRTGTGTAVGNIQIEIFAYCIGDGHCFLHEKSLLFMILGAG